MRVLLIDDDASGSGNLKEVMTHAGFEVMTARDGWTGLEHVRQRRPDAVIWGQRATGVGIAELQQLLQYDPTTQSIPCVSVGNTDLSRRDAGYQSECGSTPAEDVVRELQAALSRSQEGRKRKGTALVPVRRLYCVS